MHPAMLVRKWHNRHTMKGLLRIVVFAALAVAAFGALPFASTRMGEVVVLTSFDEAGQARETRLWIVDHDGTAYLRADGQDAGWLARIRARPAVSIDRGGRRFAARLEVDPGKTAEINAAMELKYGLADALAGVMAPRRDAIAVRVIAS